MESVDHFSDSPFRRWLGTNHAISDIERTQLRTFLQSPIDEAAHIERQIQALAFRHSHLKKEIDAHQALAHPIRRLPPELLQAVFQETLPKDHFPTIDPLQSPLVLTQVSKQWRELALSVPSLWSSIHIVAFDPDKAPPEQVQHHTLRVKRWLRAARPLQLSISLSSDVDYFPDRRADTNFLKAIVAFSPRIRLLEFKVSDILFEYFLRHASWPLLEKVVLDVEDVGRNGIPETQDINDGELWTAPKLKSIEWRGVNRDFQELPLKWGQVEEILISTERCYISMSSGCSPFILRAMMHETSSLRTLRVSVNSHEDESEHRWREHFREYRKEDRSNPPRIFDSSASSTFPLPPPPPRIYDHITLDKLTTLDLRDIWVDPSYGGATTVLLLNMSLPVLTSLTYDLRLSAYVSVIPTIDVHPLIGFMRAQAQPSPIRRWTISFTSMCRAAFIECLKLMPGLEQLRVKDGGLLDNADPEDAEDYNISQTNFVHLFPDDDLLQTMCLPQPILPSDSDSKREVLCPRLHSVRFDVGDFSIEAFHAFMEARHALSKLSRSSNPLCPTPIVPLRRFHLTALELRGSSTVMQKGGEGHSADKNEVVVPFACIGKGLCTLSNDVGESGMDVQYGVLRDKEVLENIIDGTFRKGSGSDVDPSKGIISRKDEWA